MVLLRGHTRRWAACSQCLSGALGMLHNVRRAWLIPRQTLQPYPFVSWNAQVDLRLCRSTSSTAVPESLQCLGLLLA